MAVGWERCKGDSIGQGCKKHPSGKTSLRQESLNGGNKGCGGGFKEPRVRHGVGMVVPAAQDQQFDLLFPLDLHCFKYIFPLQHHEVAVMDAVVPGMRGLWARLLRRCLHGLQILSNLCSGSNRKQAGTTKKRHAPLPAPPPRAARRFRFPVRPQGGFRELCDFRLSELFDWPPFVPSSNGVAFLSRSASETRQKRTSRELRVYFAVLCSAFPAVRQVFRCVATAGVSAYI